MAFNPAVFSIRHRLLTNVFILLVMGAGLLAYNGLSRFEDPQFTIRQAVVAVFEVHRSMTLHAPSPLTQLNETRRCEGLPLSLLEVLAGSQRLHAMNSEGDVADADLVQLDGCPVWLFSRMAGQR